MTVITCVYGRLFWRSVEEGEFVKWWAGRNDFNSG